MFASPLDVAILVYPETTAAVVYGMHDIFCSVGRDWEMITTGRAGAQLIRPLLVSRRKEAFLLCNQVPVLPAASLATCPPVGYIVVPEVNLPPDAPLEDRFDEEIRWLRERHAGGAVIAAGCSGAMLLAEAGLLDGQPATTHWAWCDSMRRRFPKVNVHEQRALVVGGEGQRLVMAGGGTSFLDLSLYLIARMLDVDTAMQVARVNLIDWHHIGQQPFARLACSRQVEDAAIGQAQAWIAAHYDEANPVAGMIRASGLSESTFKRRFRRATGMTPMEYVHTLRLEEAKQVLETEGLPVEEVAHSVGYEDCGYFIRLFKRKVNLTPAQYRKRFGAIRTALAG